ncbi:MAG: 30S ribosomal protein S2 [Methanobacteriota archaeon]|jgi:small subunit ribosomal protein S2|nr:30S ribosomal protein S2 [Candidatus Thermoplasmatota archaeon]GIR27154.1 MAG: 30S ribosomal protein S2 [Euryarchaeota archaeon]MEC7349939.1 30S ribosomal protein S2 [Candidatus Thermoplasmatota archaeon]MEC7416569.1 30S ribosomal protein S2 [Candidatus Thermoplasmatota archaeon]MEC7697278.1 30S ribosomal protein S2 [Candidatus Thermoplasmatota archaeon]|tara:strand:- start:126 stop:740 length:615 start_codon:yes stop_codon:yes gene_type:complete
MTEVEAKELLIDEDTFLTCGVHIGTKQKSKDMEPYVYKVRDDGLRILNVNMTSEKVVEAAQFLKDFDPKDVLVVSARQYGWKPATKFAENCGFECIAGRFTPGRLTNPEMRFFIEPKAIVLTDPAADAQAFREATNIKIPVIAMCDSNNLTANVDIVIPGNNKGRRSLALIYWLLSREILRIRGELGADEDLEETIDDFEAPLI